MKKLYIIAGCNGAGKTTASYTILPDILECDEFVNAEDYLHLNQKEQEFRQED